MEKAVILAAGLGTRMRHGIRGGARLRRDAAELSPEQAAVAATGVKALVPVGRPFLDYSLHALAEAGLRRVCLVVGPRHDALRRYYGELETRRIEVSFAVQDEPRGTADAVGGLRRFDIFCLQAKKVATFFAWRQNLPMEQRRYLEEPIRADLAAKMVFVAGPRQVGKTTLAQRILASLGPGVYLNWDHRDDRKAIRNAQWPGGEPLVVLDEIHKWRGWKGWIKGEFDKHRDRVRFLVTGSARLDVYRRGGDSLQGRYHHYRLHPFSYAELAGEARPLPAPGSELRFPDTGSADTVVSLDRFGGFPEPFLAQSSRTLRRWQKERVDRFLREDVRDLESVRDLASLQMLADLLPERVGAPLSLNSLREDLEVSHRALTHWMEILERLYFAFRIRPFTTRKVRSLHKMPKLYLWDNSMVQGDGERFENLLALHLLKLCHLLEDREGYRMELCYLRDRSGHEVDFLITVDKKPWLAVEAKLAATRIAPSLRYFGQRLEIPWCYQVVLQGDRDFVHDEVRCLPAHRFLAALV